MAPALYLSFNEPSEGDASLQHLQPISNKLYGAMF